MSAGFTEDCRCECGRTHTLVPGVVLGCCMKAGHEHHCIIATEHSKHVQCLCACGAVRWGIDWDEA